MTDKKFTDEKIIKALMCHFNEELDEEPFRCVDCPLYNDTSPSCTEALKSYALDLINRQNAEIERLNSANDEKFRQWDMLAEKTKQHYADLYNEAKDILKTEAYKEFAERLKEEIRLEDDCDYNCQECCYECSDYVISIDNLLKEMVGDMK